MNTLKIVAGYTTHPEYSEIIEDIANGDVGVAWTRDTTSGHSPLTLNEVLFDTYTLEVDYITWDTAASIFAASASYSAFSDLTQQVLAGARVPIYLALFALF